MPVRTGRHCRKRLALWLAALPLLALLVALVAWLLLRGSLPQLDGSQDLATLAAPASVQRDANGSADIRAGSATDAARAIGFVHAQERYFEMDLMRRSAAGELAALFGSAALAHDRAQRVHRMRWRAGRVLQGLPAEHRQLLQAYAEGVHAGLAALRVRPWPYLLVRQKPQPWTAEDSLLVGYAMYFDLQDAGNRRERDLSTLRVHLPEALHALLTHAGSQWDAPLIGDALGDAPLPDANAVDLRTLPAPTSAALPPLTDPDTPGSNSFAVAGALTDDGRAILANDMHLGLRAPNLWFRVRMRYPDASTGDDVDVAGFSLPGLPAVIVGSNTRVAWGFTNSYGDWLDFRRLPGCAGTTTATETIAVAGAASETLQVRESAWGPVLHEEANGDCLALRWVAHLPGSLDLQLAGLAGARDIESALAIAGDMALPAQNLLLADADGRIAWRLAGPVPRRDPDCAPTDPDMPSTCTPWPLVRGEPPPLLDPDGQRLWTANARTIDGHALTAIGDGGYALGVRAQQIRDALQRATVVDEAALLAIQLDDRAVLLTRWWQALQAHADEGPALRELAAAAHTWEGRAAPASSSYRLLRAWRQQVHARMLEGLLGPARATLGNDAPVPALPQFEGIAWPLLQQRPMHLLSPRYSDWSALLDDAARAVIDADTTPLSERPWGEVNRAAICHPLAAALPKIARDVLCMPREPLPGDGLVPRVQSPGFGASQRMVVAPGHEDRAIGHMPGGQSGHPLSPFWGAGHDDWVHGRPTPLLPGTPRHRLQLHPARATR
ncbi:MAG: penicillin acylase family protein [Pseudoxanthomonas suwonensis]|nr:penicillin acylase family protein [Pseudoxanthomonas suwonensis]